MSRDPDLDALQTAAAPTLERIRRDRERAPKRLKKLFTVVARRLFHPGLDAKQAWKEAGLTDHALTAAFKKLTGWSLKPYIAQARIDVAEVLVRTTDLELSTISLLVGYTHHSTFIDNYVRVKNVLPSEVSRVPPARRLIDDATSLRAGRGKFDDDEAVEYLKRYLRLYPHTAELLRTPAAPEAEPEIEVDGARLDRLTAEGVWQEIRDLPYEEQRRRVRRYLFRSTALFDLLRQKSRQEGRKERRRGIEIAELALVSLERRDEVFGARIRDLRAFGSAWLGNAYRLALDFSAADAAFERADDHWVQPGAPHEPLAAAEIDFLKGTLRMSQRSYPEALLLIDRSRELFRLAEDTHGETRALIQRAVIHHYAGSSEEALRALGEAEALLDRLDDPHLTFAVYCNLAKVHVDLGHYELASRNIGNCRDCRWPGSDLDSLKLVWLEGCIKQGRGGYSAAGQLLTAARTGYSEADDLISFALISLDLAILYSGQERWSSALDLTLECILILKSRRLHNETLAAVSLLSQAIEAGELPVALLRQVRDVVHRDTLLGCALNERTRDSSGPRR